MRNIQNCSNCNYAKNDANDKNKKFCIVKKENVNVESSCGYFWQNNNMPVSRTG